MKKPEAVKIARELAETLGPSWKPRVWENLGWHAKAVCGGLKVHPSIYSGKIEGYTAFLGKDDSCGGRWAKGGKTPEEAIRNTLLAAQADIQEANSMFNAAFFATYNRKGT